MSEYKPGTVAMATVRGVNGVRVFRRDYQGRGHWMTSDGVGSGGCVTHTDGQVTDIRPLVMLDLGDYSGERAVNYLRNLSRESRDVCGDSPSPRGKLALFIADQIEAQITPPRIDEPGLWGVVEATLPGIPTRRWVHHEEGRWVPDTGVPFAEWDDLIDPTLIREGLS